MAKRIVLAVAALMVLVAVGGILTVKLFYSQTVPQVAQAFADSNRLPGGVVAWGRAGQTPNVVAFGLADPATGRPMRRDARFMLSSLSKPMTAALVMSLVDAGRLDLDAPLARIFPDLASAPDKRYAEITAADLLRNSGGWDSAESYDPILDLSATERELGLTPEDCAPITRAMYDRPLQFDPGSRWADSNLGYCWLGLTVAAVAGSDYETAMHDWLDRNIGPNDLKIGFGATPEAARALPYQVGRDGLAPVEWDDRQLRVLGAAGGWTGTVEDYFRFASQPIDPRQLKRPDYAREGPSYYGFGWRVWPGPDGPTLSQFGAMPGVYDLVLRLPDGHVAVALYNARPPDDRAAMEWLMNNLGPAMERDQK